MTINKLWLTPKELESEYSISVSTQAKRRMDRKIPFSKVGKFIRYNRDEINQWLKDNEVKMFEEIA